MIAESLLHQIEAGREGKQWGYSMGLPKLEGIIDGVSRGVYTLVFSPTGSGKSSLALYSYVFRPLMDHLEDGNFKVSYFSLEMSSELIYAKLLSMYIFETYGIELSTKELLSKKKGYTLSDSNYEIVQKCLPWLQKVEKIVLIHDKALNAGSLYTILMQELEKDGTFKEKQHRKIYYPNSEQLTHLVVIDHLSLVRRSEGRSLKEEMDLISSYLVTLRNICKISPLVIMQANRNSTSMDRRREGLNNLRIDDTKDTGAPKNNF
jgi:replicative DNA helicase